MGVVVSNEMTTFVALFQLKFQLFLRVTYTTWLYLNRTLVARLTKKNIS